MLTPDAVGMDGSPGSSPSDGRLLTLVVDSQCADVITGHARALECLFP